MKYEKPTARDLSGLPFAMGICNTGSYPNEKCETGYTNVGPCVGGNMAGKECGAGSTPGAYTSCGPGTNASDCMTGSWAGLT